MLQVVDTRLHEDVWREEIGRSLAVVLLAIAKQTTAVIWIEQWLNDISPALDHADITNIRTTVSAHAEAMLAVLHTVNALETQN